MRGILALGLPGSLIQPCPTPPHTTDQIKAGPLQRLLNDLSAATAAAVQQFRPELPHVHPKFFIISREAARASVELTCPPFRSLFLCLTAAMMVDVELVTS